MRRDGYRAAPVIYMKNADAIEWDDDRGSCFIFYFLRCAYVTGTRVSSDNVSDARWFKSADLLTGRIACSRNVDIIVRLASATTYRAPAAKQERFLP